MSLLAAAFACFLTAAPSPAPAAEAPPIRAKRRAPVEVPDLVHEGVVYRAAFDRGGLVQALDGLTGQPLWLARIYALKYDENLERDVQDVHILTLEPVAGRDEIRVTTERGDVYVLDLRSHRARPVQR